MAPPQRGSVPRQRVPRWAAAAAGLACVGLGVVLTLRPFTSLGVLVVLVAVSMVVTGVSDLVDGRREGERTALWAGAGWIAAGLAVLVWPAVTITAITVVAGVAMVVSGVLGLVAAVRGTREDRVTAAVLGVAGVIFGLLALSWPDVTVLVVAVVFGARTVLYGLTLLLAALRWPGTARPERRRRGPLARVGRAGGAVVALAVALVLLAVSLTLHRGTPRVDAFYDAPEQVPAQAGRLLRAEPFEVGVPASAMAWRILYTTTRDDGVPALSSGIVLTSRTAPAGPRPVIAWAHGTTGYARPCAPSLQADPFGSGALPALDRIIEQGWVLVATDYIGLGTTGPHPYMIGQGEGRSVLDAVRAARGLGEVRLSGQTVVWGHSQGGGAALWTGQLAPSYAPDVPLAGVAAMAPASDLLRFADLDEMVGGSVFQSFIIEAYSRSYPDVRVEDYVRPGARAIVAEAAQRCLSEPSTLISIATSLGLDKPVFSTPVDQGALGRRLAQNTPGGPITAPLLIAQGDTDQIVLAGMQRDYAQRLCAAGQPIDYRSYHGRDHIGLVSADSPLIADLITWTRERLDGAPVANTCPAI